VRLWPKNEEEGEDGEGPPRDAPPSLLVEEEEKTNKRLFPLGQEQWPSALCYDLARNQFKSGAKSAPLVNPGQQCVWKMLIIAKLRKNGNI